MKRTAKRVIGLAVCLVMVLSMLSVFTLAADVTTVYCQAPSGWTTCKAYWWGSSAENPGWPGVDMTMGDDGIWTYDVPSDATGLIFTNGSGSQTSDLTVPTDENNMYIFQNRVWSAGPQPIVIEYFAAGSAGLLGVEWSPAAEANKLVKGENGIYTLTLTGIAAGNYQFKITNGTWDESWGQNGGQSNIDVAVAEDDSKVVITFDTNTMIPGFSINDVEPEPEPIPEGWFVAGTMNGWKCADAAYLMADNGDGTFALTFAIAAGDHALKVTNGTWDVSFGGTGEGGNFDFQVTADSEITVTFNGVDTVAVTGENVVLPEPPVPEPLPEIEFITVAGAAGLIGAEWDPVAEAGRMTANNGIYTITFENVAIGVYEFKFAANGTWDHNWASGEAVVSGEAATAWYKALGNSTIEITEADSTVTITLDLTAMDALTGEGGSFTVEVETAPKRLPGDITGDDKVNMGDVAKAFAHVRNKNKLTDEDALAAADVTGDGKVNMGDVAKIFAHVRGKNKLF